MQLIINLTPRIGALSSFVTVINFEQFITHGTEISHLTVVVIIIFMAYFNCLSRLQTISKVFNTKKR